MVLGGLVVNAATYVTAPVDRRRRTVSDWLAGTTVIAYDRDKEDPDGADEEVLDEFGEPMSVREPDPAQVRALRRPVRSGQKARRSPSRRQQITAGFQRH